MGPKRIWGHRNTPNGVQSPAGVEFGTPRDSPRTPPGQPTDPPPGRPWGRNTRKGCPPLSCLGKGCDDCVGWARLLGWARLGSPSLTRRQVGGFLSDCFVFVLFCSCLVVRFLLGLFSVFVLSFLLLECSDVESYQDQTYEVNK